MDEQRTSADTVATSSTDEPVLRVMEMDPQVDGRWESFVSCHAEATVYHHPAWLGVLEREYPQRSLHLACVDDGGRVHGVLPLLYTRGLPGGALSGVVGRRLSSLPRTPVAGPLATSPVATAALVRHAVERVDAQPGLRLQLKVTASELDGEVAGVERTPWRTTYVVPLPGPGNEVRFGDSRNHAKVKRTANQATQLGVRVRPAETEDELRAWYPLYLQAMQAHLVPPRSYRFFRGTWELMHHRGMMQLLLAERHGADGRELLAGWVLLKFGATAFYAFNGRDSRYLDLRPNDAIQWHAVHDLNAEGIRRYDLGEVAASNHGLARFKKKWGAVPCRLYRYHYPGLGTADGASEVDRSGGARKLAEAAWQRVPLRVTAAVGDQVYRFL